MAGPWRCTRPRCSAEDDDRRASCCSRCRRPVRAAPSLSAQSYWLPLGAVLPLRSIRSQAREEDPGEVRCLPQMSLWVDPVFNGGRLGTVLIRFSSAARAALVAGGQCPVLRGTSPMDRYDDHPHRQRGQELRANCARTRGTHRGFRPARSTDGTCGRGGDCRGRRSTEN